MKSKQLILLSAFVLLLASLTLGCTGATSILGNPTPTPTVTAVVTDNPTVMPTDTPTFMPVATDTPTISPDDGQSDLIANGSDTTDGTAPYDNSTAPDDGSGTT